MLWRDGRDYAATVQGDIIEGLQGATVTAQVDPLFQPLRARMLPDYRIEVAGAVEESSKGQGSIAGVPTRTAIVEAAVRRLRPIILTAAAAVVAMIPLSCSVFWGPMAVAIMGGLVVATVLTLLALPAMYAAWFRVKRQDGRASRPATGGEATVPG